LPRYYPVFIDVTERTCVVIGGGNIGQEKVEKLLESDAAVLVISPAVNQKVQDMADAGSITWERRKYQPGDLQDAFIAIAATNDNSVNRQIADEAHERNVLLNVVDVTHLCTFIAPSVARRGEVTIATSTGGASPALARTFREKLTSSRILEYADLAPVLAGARAELRAASLVVKPDHWQTLITEELLDMVQAGKTEEARQKLMDGLMSGATPAAAS
jgi:siroheme synthase-like protein